MARFEEREKIARDLHDTLLQGVQGLILKVDAAARQMPIHDPFRQSIAKALDYGDEVLTEGRNRVSSLRGSTDSLSDLAAAFRRVAEEPPRRCARLPSRGQRKHAGVASPGAGGMFFDWA